jgi:hypothetical protein
VNSHGSVLLAIGWLGARALGEAADRRAWPAESMRYVGALLAGLVVSIANPLGARLLTFPLTVGEKQRVFKTIVEWHSPDFQTTAGAFTLVFLVAAFLILMRRGAPWVDVLPAVGFVALGLVAQRNLPLAAVVLAPALGRAMSPAPDRLARARGEPSTVHLGFALVIAMAFLVFTVGMYRQGPFALKDYPVAAINFLEKSGLRGPSHRVAEQDVVGCFFDLRFGDKARVFVDDRFDMFPLAVADDYTTLLKGSPSALEVLDRRKVDVVLWDKSLALVGTLQATGKWHEAYRKGDWVVLQRT